MPRLQLASGSESVRNRGGLLGAVTQPRRWQIDAILRQCFSWNNKQSDALLRKRSCDLSGIGDDTRQGGDACSGVCHLINRNRPAHCKVLQRNRGGCIGRELFVDQHKCRSLRTSGVLLKNSAALCSHSRRTRTPFLLTLGANVLTFEANCLRTSAICSHYKRTAVRKNDPLVELQAFWL